MEAYKLQYKLNSHMNHMTPEFVTSSEHYQHFGFQRMMLIGDYYERNTFQCSHRVFTGELHFITSSILLQAKSLETSGVMSMTVKMLKKLETV